MRPDVGVQNRPSEEERRQGISLSKVGMKPPLEEFFRAPGCSERTSATSADLEAKWMTRAALAAAVSRNRR